MSTLLQQLNKQIGRKRPLFYWLVSVFNRVSEERIKEVGADMACAEWLLRNGAAVKWGNANDYLNNYDVLATMEKQNNPERGKLFIHGVDATDSGISHEGFPHFVGCKYINDIKLINCLYIGNEALLKLNYLKDSLRTLEISNCGCITEDGLDNLKQLTHLKKLTINNLPAVNNSKKILEELHKALPKCDIIHE